MNKKRLIGCCAVLLLAGAWTARYYTLNGTFAVHGICKTLSYDMYEPVPFQDYMAYGGSHFPGYSVAVKDCRIAEAADYLQEIGKSADAIEEMPDRFLILTMDVANETNACDGIEFYGMPVIGSNWYTFYNREATTYANPFFEDNVEQGFGAAVEPKSSAEIRVVYSLYRGMFNEKQWENLEKEPMWLWTSVDPVDQRIQLSLTAE